MSYTLSHYRNMQKGKFNGLLSTDDVFLKYFTSFDIWYDRKQKLMKYVFHDPQKMS